MNKIAYLYDNLGLVRPRRAPDDEAEGGEEQDEGEESHYDLAPAGERSVAGEVLVRPFLLDDVALRPALVAERPALPGAALAAADGGGARAAAVGGVRRRLVRAVVHRRGLHRRGPVPGLPRRALHVVVARRGAPRRRRRRQARHIRLRLGVHHLHSTFLPTQLKPATLPIKKTEQKRENRRGFFCRVYLSENTTIRAKEEALRRCNEPARTCERQKREAGGGGAAGKAPPSPSLKRSTKRGGERERAVTQQKGQGAGSTAAAWRGRSPLADREQTRRGGRLVAEVAACRGGRRGSDQVTVERVSAATGGLCSLLCSSCSVAHAFAPPDTVLLHLLQYVPSPMLYSLSL
jgi:hypothetical protein